MNGKINLYGRARRIALMRNVIVIIGCIVAIVVIISFIFKDNGGNIVLGEYEQLKNYFLNRGFTCEILENNGGKCISNANNVKTTFYRYDDGFEYSVKSDSYSLFIAHRLEKEDEISFRTNSNSFVGYRNQNFICESEKDVLGKIVKCKSETEGIELDIKSYLGVIEQSQVDITNAVNSSGFSLDNLIINYEWIKK